MPRIPVNRRTLALSVVLLLGVLAHATEAHAQAAGYVYAPPSYYVVPPTYYLEGAVFAPDPLLHPAPVLVPEPVVVSGPIVVSPPVTPWAYGGPVAPRAYRETLRVRPSGKHVYQKRVYAPGRIGPVYKYDYRANPKRAKIRERVR